MARTSLFYRLISIAINYLVWWILIESRALFASIWSSIKKIVRPNSRAQVFSRNKNKQFVLCKRAHAHIVYDFGCLEWAKVRETWPALKANSNSKKKQEQQRLVLRKRIKTTFSNLMPFHLAWPHSILFSPTKRNLFIESRKKRVCLNSMNDDKDTFICMDFPLFGSLFCCVFVRTRVCK